MSKAQRLRIENLERALKIAWNQLTSINAMQGCPQGCGGTGAIQLTEDDWDQCQWCGEQEIIRAALGIEDEPIVAPTQMADPNELPF